MSCRYWRYCGIGIGIMISMIWFDNDSMIWFDNDMQYNARNRCCDDSWIMCDMINVAVLAVIWFVLWYDMRYDSWLWWFWFWRHFNSCEKILLSFSQALTPSMQHGTCSSRSGSKLFHAFLSTEALEAWTTVSAWRCLTCGFRWGRLWQRCFWCRFWAMLHHWWVQCFG